jgi:TonB dependent receptor-like, beta-barrel/TonB-dependent Receptor Plug Domain
MRFIRSPGARALALSLFLSGAPQRLAGQAAACVPAAVPGTAVLERELAQLPVDRIADLLALEPGVVSLDQGDLSVRGAGPGATSAYLDGVPVTPGHRRASPLLGGSYFGEPGVGIGIGTNGFDRISLYRGIRPAEFGAGRGGAIAVSTTCPADVTPSLSPMLRAGWASDALFGNENGLGFNRITLDGGARAGWFSFGGAAVLEGLSSERLGLEQNQSPVFVLDGVDTTVAFDPGGGTVSVDVARFRRSEGIRIPSSATSQYTLQARLGYQLGQGQHLELAAYASQRQARIFEYANLYSARQARADRAWSRVLTGSWFGSLKQGGALALRGEAHLSWQTDRSIAGPLSVSGEQGSRDPFGGFLVSPVGFRFAFDNFPVNDDLVRNFRTNTGRRSPYDLNNTSQYSLIDLYRNNAYGLTGFVEGGGPIGLLTLYREDRLVGKGVLEGRFREHHRVRLGLELARYDLDLYESQLTSQANSSAYVEAPHRTALFGDYEVALGPARLNAGLRYDRFSTGASRPDFPRISSAPGFDAANPAAGFVKDESHTRISPSIRGSYQATPRLMLHAGVAGQAQLPDFAATLAGINTDFGVTNAQQVYGSDLDYEHATQFEFGAEVEATRGLTAAATVWHRKDEGLVGVELVTEFDPLLGANRDILRYRNVGSLRTTGLELHVSRRLGSRAQAWVGYTYADPSQETEGTSPFGSSLNVPVAEARPHTVTGAVLYRTASDGRVLGGLLRDVGIYAAARLASGTAYTRCPASVPENDGVLSGEPCATFFEGDFNGSRLPMLRLVDLRLTRELRLGATRLVVFADARNLLNSRNVTRVFSQTGGVTNVAEGNRVRVGSLDEFAVEADANGVRQPDGAIDLSFGGVANPRAACGSWILPSGVPNVPNCIYLIGAEERWGNGDHVFTTAEQARASDALYQVARGLQNFTGPGRRVRLGLELGLQAGGVVRSPAALRVRRPRSAVTERPWRPVRGRAAPARPAPGFRCS